MNNMIKLELRLLKNIGVDKSLDVHEDYIHFYVHILCLLITVIMNSIIQHLKPKNEN